MHAFAETHETPESVPPDASLGVGRIVQLVPFQRSASVATPPKEPPKSPTAMQILADGHEAASSSPLPAGLGGSWIDHLVPFHRSATVPGPPVPVNAESDPTAMHALAEKHEIPCSAELLELVVGRIVHLLPLQRSASAL
jgi:hypothetical protein